MNVLVTGANGQLGREMRIAALRSGNRYVFADIIAADGLDTLILDVTDEGSVRSVAEKFDIDVIVNCAAYTDVDKAETDVETCRKLNAEVPGILASVMKDTGGLLVHVSTDYVFDGNISDRPYCEDDSCDPQNVYGRTKYLGEISVKESGCRHIIIRTAWLYSGFGKNFVRKMLELTGTRSQVKVVADQRGTPTYARDLAETILYIIENAKVKGKYGIYHYSNEGECTWHEFAMAIAEYSRHDKCEILPCTSEEFPSPVKRPAFSVLDKSKIMREFGIRIPHWADSLRKCLNNRMYSDR